MEQAGGYTPLHQAAAAGLAEVTKILLEAGANPACLCHQGKDPADYARERSTMLWCSYLFRVQRTI